MLRDAITAAAGLALAAGIGYLAYRSHRLEKLMNSATQQINALADKVDAQSTLLGDIAADFDAFKTAMEAERDRLTPEGQAALDRANVSADLVGQRLADLDTKVGDADGSDKTDVPAEPETPGDETSTNPTV
jgi:hypothetical protein